MVFIIRLKIAKDHPPRTDTQPVTTTIKGIKFSAMEAAASSLSSQRVAIQAQVSVMKGANEQLEAVMATLLAGLEAAARAPEQTGQTLNITA